MVKSSLERSLDAGNRVYSAGHRRMDRTGLPPAFPSNIVEGQTSKMCPHCMVKDGEKIVRSHKRIRRYEQTEPCRFKELDPNLPIHLPRRSSHLFFRSIPFLSGWISTPEIILDFSVDPPLPDRTKIDPESYPWCQCWCYVRCTNPLCRTKGREERVSELDCVRPFSHARLQWLQTEKRYPLLKIFFFSR